MKDVGLELLEDILQEYDSEIKNSSAIAEIIKRVEAGEANYDIVNEYAREAGAVLAKIYQKKLTSDILPDGKMYFNIAERIVGRPLERCYDLIAGVAEPVQKILNMNAGIGIKPVRPALNDDRINGIINRVSSENNFSDIKWILDAPVRCFAQSVVDDFIKINSEFQGKAGLHPKIIRKSSGHCCKWCEEIEGVYEYPDVPKDVYRRHDNCDCMVEYDPGDGRGYQDVWSKKWSKESKAKRIKKIEALTENGSRKMLSDKVEDVTKEYVRRSVPGKGRTVIHKGFDEERRKADLETAEWIVQSFGGEIRLLEEANIPGILTADFEWNGKQWEAKTISSINSIDKQIRKGSNQVGASSGGLIIDISGRTIKKKEAVDEIVYRLPKRAKGNMDVIIRDGDTFVKALRYKR